ncbi:MAG: tetratricopeptide repeat protein [Bryobacteraceae bacterium]|nr:tetratricopeptide repeat protein [Bryobacteraceae bacterium]
MVKRIPRALAAPGNPGFRGRASQAACLLFSLLAVAAAQVPSGCTAPPDLAADIQSQPSAEAYSALGYWFIERGQTKCAISSFREAVKRNPKLLEARYNLGLALSQAGDHGGAVEHLRAAAGLKPGDTNVQTVLSAALQEYAATLLRQNRSQEAEGALRESISVAPSDPKPYLTLGLHLTQQKRYTEATQVLRKGLAAKPKDAALLSALGMTLVRMRQLEAAAGVFRSLIEVQPGSAEAHVNLGVTLADMGNQPEALKSFNEAVRLNPILAAAHYYRGRALHELKQHEEAREALETALRLQPGYMPAMLVLGNALASLGKQAEAAELLEKVVKAEPGNGKARLALGQALIRLGRKEEGIVHLREAARIDPMDSQAAYALLRALAGTQSPEFEALAKRVRELKQNELAVTQARVLSNLGLDAAKEKDWQTAVSKLRAAVDACGSCPIRAALQKNLGLILARSGDVAAARKELEAARQMDPTDLDIQYALDILP